MGILVFRTNESVTFTLPDGAVVQIVMLKMSGEDTFPYSDADEAFRILKYELNYYAGYL